MGSQVTATENGISLCIDKNVLKWILVKVVQLCDTLKTIVHFEFHGM